MTGLGYTVPAVLAVTAVCAWELAFLRTGLFRRASYWVAMAIVLAVQIPVDGWLTKLSAPVVRYAPGQMTGLRFPWDIPVEDFLFGFALITAALLLWEHQGRRRAGPGPGRRSRPGRPVPGRPLWRSVEGFDGAKRFRRRLREARFTGVHSETMTGWQRDVVHTFLATAPAGAGAGAAADGEGAR
jgi:lycopene cyclase domain-containing protein